MVIERSLQFWKKESFCQIEDYRMTDIYSPYYFIFFNEQLTTNYEIDFTVQIFGLVIFTDVSTQKFEFRIFEFCNIL